MKFLFYFLQQNVVTHQLELIMTPKKQRTYSTPTFKEGKQEHQRGSDT